MSSFKGQVLSCIFDLNANHVIQKFLTVISEHAREAHEQGDQDLALSLTQSLDVIVDEVINDCEELCKHAYGCRVVQRLVEHGLDPIQSRVLDNVIACHESLIDDKFGNYVIGRLIACGRKEDREAIVKTMSGNVLKFSKNKQASNVVEAMLQHGDVAQRKKILQEMLNVSVVSLIFLSPFLHCHSQASICTTTYSAFVLTRRGQYLQSYPWPRINTPTMSSRKRWMQLIKENSEFRCSIRLQIAWPSW